MGAALIKKTFDSEKWEDEIYEHTSEQKMISGYMGIGVLDVDNLPYSLYFLYRRDAWIHAAKQSEEGRELLKTCWRLRQTEPDLEAIRNKMGVMTERRN